MKTQGPAKTHEKETDIQNLGKCARPSPIPRGYVSKTDRVIIDVDHAKLSALVKQKKEIPSFEKAGPRKRIHFDPKTLTCAIVTCGGLCPGLNDVIRAIVLELSHGYGVEKIMGARHGLQGFIPKYGRDFMELTPKSVDGIQNKGGSILGSSRGAQNIDEIVDTLERKNIQALFIIGGDGSLKAADKIGETATKRRLNTAVVGIPKTIDNDIYMTSRSFGFDTAVEISTQAVKAAHNEATGYPNGIGLVKLMGRDSGFIAATAAIAQQDVNFVLIPEVDFDIQGPQGLLSALSKRLESRGHAVIVAAEGAGQNLFKTKTRRFDESGNSRKNDISLFLKEAISDHLATKKIAATVKYIDPSYIIRSLPANANDSAFCGLLGRDAAHAAMSGKTRLIIGSWNDQFVHIPIQMAIKKKKQVAPMGKLWLSAMESTGQGALKNRII